MCKTMREDIIDIIYDAWMDNRFAEMQPLCTGTRAAINGIIDRFHATGADLLYIERTINAATTEKEENAFKNGFYLCLELVNGNILKEDN